MIIDFLTLNIANIYLSTILLNIYNLNDKKLYLILLLDIVINGIPFITMIIIILYYLNKFIFKYLNYNFINKFIALIFYYFIFNITLYSIFNNFNKYILEYLLNNLSINLIFYYVGLKYLEDKYNLKGDINE